MKAYKLTLLFAGLGILFLGLWYLVGERQFSSKTELPPYAGEPFRASIVSDIHYCGTGAPPRYDLMDLFLADALRHQSDFIASLGDNANHRLSDCSKTADEDARLIADYLRKAGLPTYFVLGDHDISSSVSSYEAWIETSGRRETYYSFDVKDVHVIVLDTILGGEPMSPPCEEKESCRHLENQKKDLAALPYEEYRARYRNSLRDPIAEKKSLKEAREKEEDLIAETRSSGRRDVGRLSAAELSWLEEDISATRKKKILILSDHPLFHFVSSRKEYDIVRGKELRALLEKKEREGSEVVSIAGEAHLWHAEERNGVAYYIVDLFRNTEGAWAHIAWPNEGFRFEKITHPEAEKAREVTPQVEENTL